MSDLKLQNTLFDSFNYIFTFKLFRWTYIYEFRQNPEECLDARYSDLGNIYREKCHEMGGNQKFIYDEVFIDELCSFNIFINNDDLSNQKRV